MHRQFVNRMLHDDVKAAISLLDSDEHPGAPMRLNMLLDPETPSWTARDELLKKHPSGQPAHSDVLKVLEDCRFHPVIFDALDEALIRGAALRT